MQKEEMSNTVKIFIAIGIVVLIALVAFLFFLREGKDIANSCNLACSQENYYSYCFEPRDAELNGNKLTGITCNYLSQETDFEIESCPAITCGDFVNIVTGETRDETVQQINIKCGELRETLGNEEGSPAWFKIFHYFEEGELKEYPCFGGGAPANPPLS
jgi:hypothetical protein